MVLRPIDSIPPEIHGPVNPTSAGYEEALRCDPKDVRNNNALGLWFLRKGKFDKAEPYFRKAIATLTQRNAIRMTMKLTIT